MRIHGIEDAHIISPMTRTIYIVGPSSTGKTTLCEVLAKRLGLSGSAYITEVARQVMKEKGYTREDVGNIQMQMDIMIEHLKREEAGLSDEHRIVLCDRSAIDPVVYARLTAQSSGEDQSGRLTDSQAFRAALERYRDPSSLFILLGPVTEWIIDDGIRSLERQEECLQRYRECMKLYDIPYRELGQDTRNILERMVFTIGLLNFPTSIV
ncbi:hypothetical protein CC2G_004278 [Coprinopsis cinerea AmutBmut pab1-1]|nr:hypothetical protein CC2G_004278 [Coprinopsis cinerea AmutBmut pab1-1]